MTDQEIRAEIARQVREALSHVAESLRNESGGPGGPPANKALARAANAVQAVVDRW
jgi:hypothetical protein